MPLITTQRAQLAEYLVSANGVTHFLNRLGLEPVTLHTVIKAFPAVLGCQNKDQEGWKKGRADTSTGCRRKTKINIPPSSQFWEPKMENRAESI